MENTLKFCIVVFTSLIINACASTPPREILVGEDVDCPIFWPVEESNQKPYKSCGTINSEGLVTLKSEFTQLIDFDEYGMACLGIETNPKKFGWYHMTKEGYARGGAYYRVMNCLPFTNNVSVTYIKGRAVYFNRNLNSVKHTSYEYAGVFHDGKAKVCSKKPRKQYDGEHYSWAGGQCGFIDESFDEVIETKYPFETTPVPTGNLYYALEPMEWLTTLASLGAAAIPQKNAVLDVVYDYKTYAIDADGDKLASPYTEQERKGYVHGVTFRLKDQSVWVALIKEDLNNARTILSVKPQ